MKVYCIGIGGIGMSGIARLLKEEGHDVSGSDLEKSDITDALQREDVRIFFHQTGDAVTHDFDIVIYSAAIPENHPELAKAKSFEIPIHSYSEVLGEYSRNKDSIAVAGTHGKTTTTGMLASVFLAAGRDPSALVGSLMKDFGGSNVLVGNDNEFIVEACEYKRNFSPLFPKYVLLTNLDFDHCDYFQTEDHYFRTFKFFLGKVPPNGFIVMRSEDSVKIGADYFQCPVIFYDEYVEYLKNLKAFEMKVFGEHNYWNAACVFAFAKKFGITEEHIIEGLKNFSGTWRRLEYKGDLSGASIYDDYAHHPSEVKATLAALRQKYPHKTIRAVFQPHQFSRTKFFLNEFAVSFVDANEVIVPNIYRVRDSEEAVQSVSLQDLLRAFSSSHNNVRDGKGLLETLRYLRNSLTESDVVVVMGAGDVTRIASELMDV